MSRLTVTDVTVRYGAMDGPVLGSVDLDIEDGSFVSLLGPSGCGKTSLLRVIGGLTEPVRGSVQLDGKEAMGASPEKVFVFQHFNLFPWRTAVDNVAYYLEIQHVSKAERRAKAIEALTIVGLENFAGHYPAELSGGMQQRVGLARALTLNPRVLLMDEPFGAVDALTRERLQAQLAEICADRQLTTVFVTHSIDEAVVLSDRVVVMAAGPGRIIADVPIPFSRPRVPERVRLENGFPELRSELWSLLQSPAGSDA